ncbi:hypothetical protein BIY22_20345 [Vibrio panuliri]|uniref:DUF2607 domain-containing protein n=1 Tax=Vibrio panuliri TaxID=1381081 RepID=A0A1Q9HGT9_9VIBR|nr:DUF2607 family protein [Vibrio panuliri]OLQ89155.1 hypothetical protein BIY22_20345 [Vibrio panuliri]
MFYRLGFLSSHKFLVVLCTVMLLLWTNLAVIHHQLDLDTQHHEHHTCQLFSCITNGAKTSVLTLLLNNATEAPPSLTVYRYLEVPLIAQIARAPPKLI